MSALLRVEFPPVPAPALSTALLAVASLILIMQGLWSLAQHARHRARLL